MDNLGICYTRHSARGSKKFRRSNRRFCCRCRKRRPSDGGEFLGHMVRTLHQGIGRHFGSISRVEEETGVKLIAVSVDDEKTARRIKPMVNGRGWTDFEIYHDYKGELKRAMNIVSVPYLIVIHNGEIVYQRNAYTPGDEEELYEFLLELK